MHIAIIGGGQLARMLAQEGITAGHTFSFLVESELSAQAVNGLGIIVVMRSFDNARSVFSRLGEPDVITVETENVDVNQLDELSKLTHVFPSTNALYIIQNRQREKKYLKDLNIPTVDFISTSCHQKVSEAFTSLGSNVIIKSCESGYDGKNQWRIKSQKDLDRFANECKDGTHVVVEKCVNFSCEVSLIAACGVSGDIKFYPLSINEHSNGTLVTSTQMLNSDEESIELSKTAKVYLNKIIDKLNYVGVIAMECFVVDGQLIVNELAPRVHNSGHWTQAGCQFNQFENHIRAITNTPLGSTKLTSPSAMLNLLGKKVHANDITIPGASLHWYEKDCLPGRKVGHINLIDHSASQLTKNLNSLKQQVYGPTIPQ